MDSIFQIKINENKLQKIINQLIQNQTRLQVTIQDILIKSNDNSNKLLTLQNQTQNNLSSFRQKTQQNFKYFTQSYQLSFSRLQKQSNIKFEEISARLEILQQQSIQNHQQQQTNPKLTQFDQEIAKFNEQLVLLNKRIEQLQEMEKIQNVQKFQKIDKTDNNRIQKLQKLVAKIIQATELLHNKNFVYFMQMLIDKEQVTTRPQQANKDTKNPFLHETGQDKMKRIRQFRKCLQQTHNRIQNMQTQYTGYFNFAFQGNKQNRQDTHMHYAFLSSKIKQIESKLLEQQQTNNVQKTQKILYPSTQIKQKKQKHGSKALIQIDNSSIYKQLIKQQIGLAIKLSSQSFKKDLIYSCQKLQDKIWSISNKADSFKSNLELIKGQVEKVQERLKLNSYYNQYSYEKQNLIPKTIGEFLHQFRCIQQTIEDKLKQKMDRTQFTKFNQQITQKIKIMNEQVNEKSDKQETRRAFTFIEQKIRQIITLIVGMQSSSKKTAISRTMMQCLSCDDYFFQQTHVPKQSLQKIIRTTTTSRAHSMKSKRNLQKYKKETAIQPLLGLNSEK